MENIVNSISTPASAVLDATTLLATPSSSVKVEGRKTGAVVKVPVLVGRTIVQIYIEALAELDEPALEITNIKHDLNLAGCEFMQVEDAKNGKLVISGYIRENIVYTSAKVAEDGSVSTGSKRTGMNIPFKCFTKMQLDSEPVTSTSNSLFNLEGIGSPGVANANNLYYLNSNEELSFEVAETKIRQVNVKRNTADISINNYSEQAFSSLSINMSVDIALVILQNQFVEIPSSGKSGSNNQSSDGNNENGSSSNGGNNGKSSNGSNSNGNSKNNKNSDNGKKKGNQKLGSKSSKYGWLKNFSYFGKMFG